MSCSRHCGKDKVKRSTDSPGVARYARGVNDPWYRDRWLWAALAVAVALRVVMTLANSPFSCINDECTYIQISSGIVRGEGMTAPMGWLWAPGYPHLLAVAEVVARPSDFRWVQVLLSSLNAALAYLAAMRIADRRVARHAAFAVALHPTLAFFASALFTETVYSTVLFATVLGVLWSREGRWTRGLAVGVGLAACAYLRGVGVWIVPVFALGLLWPDGEAYKEAFRARWRHVAAAVITAIVLVAPYSWHASQKHGGLVITDATVGDVAFLGNSDFPLTTHDWGNGFVNPVAIRRHNRPGGDRCDRALPAAQWNACELDRSLQWISNNPAEFVRRVPMRWAQLLNPNSFLTRHVRMGRNPRIPWWLKEGIVLWVLAASTAVTFGGTLGASARARGPFGVPSIGLVLFQLAVVAGLYGMTRFRVPLVPLWIVWLAVVTAHPMSTWRAMWSSPRRRLLYLGATAALVPLVATFFLSGIPALWR